MDSQLSRAIAAATDAALWHSDGMGSSHHGSALLCDGLHVASAHNTPLRHAEVNAMQLVSLGKCGKFVHCRDVGYMPDAMLGR
jgi:hypothetical protein